MKLGDVAKVGAGNAAPQATRLFEGGTHPFFRTSDAGRVRFGRIHESTDYLNDEGVRNLRRYPKGTILFPKSGASTFLNHRVMLAVDGYVSSHLATIVADATQINATYLLYFLSTIEARDLVQDHAYPSLNLPTVAGIDIQVPPLAEQEWIVSVLDQAFEGIAAAKVRCNKNLANARALLASQLHAVFTRRGPGWEDKRLGEICDRVSVGHVGSTSEFYCDEADGVPFIRSQNVRRGRLDWNGIRYITKEFHQRLRKSQLRAGDLLFVRVGANRGDCCSVPAAIGEVNCANIVFARPTEGNATYLERYCDSFDGRAQLLGMTTGSAQGVINTSSVARLVIPMPPLSEQRQIVESLNELQAETERLGSIYERKLAMLDDLKKSLLHEAFTGQLEAHAT